MQQPLLPTMPIRFSTLRRLGALHLLVVAACARAVHVQQAPIASPLAAPALPTRGQLQLMEMGLAQFMHFSVNPWSKTVQHDCVGGPCIPASVFNPTNLSTDQWVEAAVAMGAGEICLTAHHEGGFSLWDTAYSNYSVMHSPYGKDIVKEFVRSCQKYGVRPCYYMGPNSNGYFMSQNYTADRFVDSQLGMLRELLTNYGSDYVGRLWWDHYPGSCNTGLEQCPQGSFPAAWPKFVDLVREVSPSTVICPGPDCDGHMGESGLGKYPSWFPCRPDDDSGETCTVHGANASFRGFHPYETCVSLHDGWFARGDGTAAADNSYWSAQEIWDHYMSSVGIGWVNTLNAPPGTTGLLDPSLVGSMRTFGSALRALLKPVTSAATTVAGGTVQLTCAPGKTAENTVELSLENPSSINAVMTREDLTLGQAITSYEIDVLTHQGWQTIPQCGLRCSPNGQKPPGAIPSVPRGECGGTMQLVNTQLNSDGSSARKVATTNTEAACEMHCHDDPTCNFWTWYGLNASGPAANSPGACFLLDSHATYSYRSRQGYFSGVCNHSLPRAGDVSGFGIHGLSVGSRMIDFLPANFTSDGIRFRCTSSMMLNAQARLQSFSAHYAERPA